MTETQATPGATSTSQADSDGAGAPDNAAADSATRTVVGRASVGGDGAPKFTRAPGMAPPPDSPEPSSGPPATSVTTGRAAVPASARVAASARATPVESATAPISSPAAGARTRAVPLGSGRVAEAVRN